MSDEQFSLLLEFKRMMSDEVARYSAEQREISCKHFQRLSEITKWLEDQMEGKNETNNPA